MQKKFKNKSKNSKTEIKPPLMLLRKIRIQLKLNQIKTQLNPRKKISIKKLKIIRKILLSLIKNKKIKKDGRMN